MTDTGIAENDSDYALTLLQLFITMSCFEFRKKSIYEAMRKIPVLKKKSTNAQKKFAKEFCHIVSVFKKNSPSLYKTLVKKKQGIEEDIIKLKGVIHANTLTSDLQKQSKTYENALTELDQARQFYAQFENIQM